MIMEMFVNRILAETLTLRDFVVGESYEKDAVATYEAVVMGTIL